MSRQIQVSASDNATLALENKAALEAAGVLMVNIMAAPGAGVTRLIQQTVSAFSDLRVGVIEANIAGNSDISKVRAAGASAAVQIDTGPISHLSAEMLGLALGRFDLAELDILLLENIGDLIRPADWYLGEQLKVCLVSVCGSDDVALKFPSVFAKADAVVLSKLDLLPYVDFNRDSFYTLLRKVNDTTHTLELSCKTGDGLELWLAYLRRHLKVE